MNLRRELENFIISINKTRLLILNLRQCSQWSSHRGCSIKKLFLKISQYLQENICVKVSFNQVAGLQVCIFIKKRFQHRCFSVSIEKFKKTRILKKICEQLLLNNLVPNFSSVSLKVFLCFLTFAGKHLYQVVLFDKCSCRPAT